MLYAHWFGHNEVSKIMAPHGIGPILSDMSIFLESCSTLPGVKAEMIHGA